MSRRGRCCCGGVEIRIGDHAPFSISKDDLLFTASFTDAAGTADGGPAGTAALAWFEGAVGANPTWAGWAGILEIPGDLPGPGGTGVLSSEPHPVPCFGKAAARDYPILIRVAATLAEPRIVYDGGPTFAWETVKGQLNAFVDPAPGLAPAGAFAAPSLVRSGLFESWGCSPTYAEAGPAVPPRHVVDSASPLAISLQTAYPLKLPVPSGGEGYLKGTFSQ